VSYRVAPIFLIRLAGVPFEVLELLSTRETCQVARRLLESGGAINADREMDLGQTIERELYHARSHLVKSARTILPRYLLFSGAGARALSAHLQSELVAHATISPRRNSRAGDRERHILLYLQRTAAKNDTFGEFGPSSWGKVSNGTSGITFAPVEGIVSRDAFLERWAAHGIAAVMNAEPNNPERLHVVALEPHAFEILRDDVEKWLAGPSRAKWLPVLRDLADIPRRFSSTVNQEDRESIFGEARSRLQSVGVEPKSGGRFLYTAINPIGEECFRETSFAMSEQLVDEVVAEAEPWIDFWRDSFAFVASRVAAALRSVLEKSGARNGVMPLPAFLQACDVAKLPLIGPGLIAPAAIAFQEVKAAFRERLQPYAHLSEYQLTPQDCHIVRDNFNYPKFDEYSYPSADLQLAAASREAIVHGDYQWILAELHPPIALLQHCMFWSCPDKGALGRALASTTLGRPNFHFGFFAADFTAHTTVRIFDAMPKLTNFVAPQRANPKWRKVSPPDAEVYIDPASGDVCLRKIDSKEYLGSFARAWVIPLGFHPFQFGLGSHTPRLRCGKVIVQRRSWTISLEEFPPGKYNGVSSALVLAVEKLRADKNLPRFVYIRPTEQALRRSGAEGRDKDTKPVFVDLESYLFLEIFYRWIVKSGEIEVTEMLPAPEDLLWKEADGRHSFELRTLIVPRS
jgi:hypothetical protein